MNRAFYIPEIGEKIPITNPNRQSYSEESRRFSNFTDTFIARYGNFLHDTGVSTVAHVSLSDNGEFIDVPYVSAKSSDPGPNHVFLELDTTDGIAWRVEGSADDPYEVIFDDDGSVTVATYELSIQHSLLSARKCTDEEAKMIFALIKDICECEAVKNKLKKFNKKEQAILQTKIAALNGNQKHIKEAVKALQSGSRFPQGVSRSRRYDEGQVNRTPIAS